MKTAAQSALGSVGFEIGCDNGERVRGRVRARLL